MFKSIKDMNIVTLIREGLHLEFTTNAGRFNVLFTLILLVLIPLVTVYDVAFGIIYAVCFHEKFVPISFWGAAKVFLICGSLCFIYMMFIADKRKKVRKKINKIKSDK